MKFRKIAALSLAAALAATIPASAEDSMNISITVDPQTELRHIRALPLSDEEKAAILGGNAKRLLRI